MTDEIVASQREYYDERAEDYGDASRPDRKMPGLLPDDLVRSLVDEFAPTGDVLELACGTGIFTRELVRHARTLTAVDGSPRMLEINRQRVGDRSVTYVLADLFSWEPDRTYDEVFAEGVPAPRFADAPVRMRVHIGELHSHVEVRLARFDPEPYARVFRSVVESS